MRRAVFTVAALLIFIAAAAPCLTSTASAGQGRLRRLIERREAEIRAEQARKAGKRIGRTCPRCGAVVEIDGARFCPSCGAPLDGGVPSGESAAKGGDRGKLQGRARGCAAGGVIEIPAAGRTPVDRAVAAELVGFWLYEPPVVTLPVRDDVFAQAAQLHLLQFFFEKGRLMGRHCYTDYRRFHECPSVHRNDIEERRQAKRFPVELSGRRLRFCFDAFLDDRVFRLSAKVSYKSHYVWRFDLRFQRDGTLAGLVEKDFYREKVRFRKIGDKEGAWLLNKRNRRRRLEEALAKAVRPPRSALPAVPDTVEGAAFARMVQALASREARFFDERDRLLGRIADLSQQVAQLERQVDDLEDDKR